MTMGIRELQPYSGSTLEEQLRAIRVMDENDVRKYQDFLLSLLRSKHSGKGMHSDDVYVEVARALASTGEGMRLICRELERYTGDTETAIFYLNVIQGVPTQCSLEALCICLQHGNSSLQRHAFRLLETYVEVPAFKHLDHHGLLDSLFPIAFHSGQTRDLSSRATVFFMQLACEDTLDDLVTIFKNPSSQTADVKANVLEAMINFRKENVEVRLAQLLTCKLPQEWYKRIAVRLQRSQNDKVRQLAEEAGRTSLSLEIGMLFSRRTKSRVRFQREASRMILGSR